MAPLIPEGIISPNLNLFFAFVIGIAFGYVLEQGGFSTSRKLAGVFTATTLSYSGFSSPPQLPQPWAC